MGKVKLLLMLLTLVVAFQWTEASSTKSSKNNTTPVIRETILNRNPSNKTLDREGEFIKNNPNFTDNKLLHTFTLDKEDNVILVGDPSTNPKIKQLLFNTIKQPQL